MVSLNGLMIFLILSVHQQTHGYPTIENSNSHKGRLLLADRNERRDGWLVFIEKNISSHQLVFLYFDPETSELPFYYYLLLDLALNIFETKHFTRSCSSRVRYIKNAKHFFFIIIKYTLEVQVSH